VLRPTPPLVAARYAIDAINTLLDRQLMADMLAVELPDHFPQAPPGGARFFVRPPGRPTPSPFPLLPVDARDPSTYLPNCPPLSQATFKAVDWVVAHNAYKQFLRENGVRSARAASCGIKDTAIFWVKSPKELRLAFDRLHVRISPSTLPLVSVATDGSPFIPLRYPALPSRSRRPPVTAGRRGKSRRPPGFRTTSGCASSRVVPCPTARVHR
jgi:hypothetical protein